MSTKRKIDHIVYCVPNLPQAIDDLEEQLGVRPAFGGYHTTKGTKNALLNLGEGIYLEILAPDEDNTEVKGPRWMGIDFLKEAGVTRWALKSEDLKQDSAVLKRYKPKHGEISGGTRKTTSGKLLTWEMILPLAEPAVDLAPFMVDWRKSELHPTDNLALECELLSVEFTDPAPDSVANLFKDLGGKWTVKKGVKSAIRIKIKCPRGVVNL